MRKKDLKVALFPQHHNSAVSKPSPPIGVAQVGKIVGLSPDGVPLVDFAASEGPTPARLAVAASIERLQAAVADHQPIVLVFEDGDPGQPIIIGLIESPTSAAIVQDTPDESPIVEADVDGKRVCVTAQDEIILQCGAASVTLRRNGRVVIRGTYVETHSDGTNRIKGGQVQIN